MTTQNNRVRQCGDYTWPACYTIEQYIARYGEADILILLEEVEEQHYVARIDQLQGALRSEPDMAESVQVALGVWRPLQGRERTDLEQLADKWKGLQPEEREQLRRNLEAWALTEQRRIALQRAERAASDATAMQTTASETISPPAAVAPVTAAEAAQTILPTFEQLAELQRKADADAMADKGLYDAPAPFEQE